MFKAMIKVMLKKGVLDPQGSAVVEALHTQNFVTVESVRVGKFLELYIDEDEISEARGQLEKICRQILANPVIEDYEFDLLEVER